jgi:hypothetical protein
MGKRNPWSYQLWVWVESANPAALPSSTSIADERDAPLTKREFGTIPENWVTCGSNCDKGLDGRFTWYEGEQLRALEAERDW